MDEPFGAVDPIVRAELQVELLRLQRELGKTVVFVTHDIDEAFLLGDQVVILEKGGRVAQIGTPVEILSDPATEFVAHFVGAERGKRALSIRNTDRGEILVDGEGRAAGVLVDSAAGSQYDAGPKSRSVSNKTSQAGDA
jgi:osmoprotectant transport system ATP-binding protein